MDITSMSHVNSAFTPPSHRATFDLERLLKPIAKTGQNVFNPDFAKAIRGQTPEHKPLPQELWDRAAEHAWYDRMHVASKYLTPTQQLDT
jgi:hypothetical protein